jgi:hypothetical protein
LKTILNRSRSRESTTPSLESHKYFTVVVHYRTEAEGTGIFPNEATAIEFSSGRCLQKFAENPEVDPLENDFNSKQGEHDPDP